MDGEHIFEVDPISENTTRFIRGEDDWNMLARLFGSMVPDSVGAVVLGYLHSPVAALF